jgi:glycosyltransferase involved in cell wall biosynthesis
MALITGLATAGGRRPPALVSLHGSPEEDWPAAVRAVRLSGLDVVACGPGVAAAVEARGIAVRATVPNAVGPPPLPADRAVLEREWHLEGKPLVLAVGRLVEQKNHALAIRALEYVRDAKLVIVGEGPLRAELEQLAGRAAVDDRVVLAGLRRDARALMGAADAIVLPSWWEGLPLTALEALASGTPLVATAVRGMRELLYDGEDALLVPPEDPAALGAALTRVLEDRGLASRLADAGRLVAADASEEKMVASYLRVYEEILAR